MTTDVQHLTSRTPEVVYRGGLPAYMNTREQELVEQARDRLNLRLREWVTEEEAQTLLPAGRFEVELSPGYTCTKSEWDTAWGCHIEIKSKRKYAGYNQEEELLLTREVEIGGKSVRLSIFEKVFVWDQPKEHAVSEIIVQALDEENKSTLYVAPMQGYSVGFRVCGENERKSREYFERELSLVSSGAIEKNDKDECEKVYQKVRKLFFTK
jgi:hypothetical protein